MNNNFVSFSPSNFKETFALPYICKEDAEYQSYSYLHKKKDKDAFPDTQTN